VIPPTLSTTSVRTLGRLSCIGKQQAALVLCQTHSCLSVHHTVPDGHSTSQFDSLQQAEAYKLEEHPCCCLLAVECV
jgi:hypothetical protein